MEHFNSRPHEEVDPELKNHNHLKGISTHDLTRRSTLIRITFLSFSVFQLTTSRGGRPVYTNQLFKQSNISTHDLTRRSTYIDLVLMLFGIYFNSRPHEEVDLIQRLVWTLVIHFNSRPHEEVDSIRESSFYCQQYFNSRPHEEVDSDDMGGADE